MSSFVFEVSQYEFNYSLRSQLEEKRQNQDLWPLVYILSDGQAGRAYVGETMDVFSRMEAHQRHQEKQLLTTVHLINSRFFNKSATLDIESSLIRYMSADGLFTLMNSNIGISDYSYYQRAEYQKTFSLIWDHLIRRGLAKHSLDHIENSDLFKYSPYKSLSDDQIDGLLEILKALAYDDSKNIIIEGGAGTGKTILAIFLFKLLSPSYIDLNYKEFGDRELEIYKVASDVTRRFGELSMGLVIPVSSFRSTVQKIFSNIGGLNAKMVIGPTEVVNQHYDLLVVDESHRLRQRVVLGSYFKHFNDASEKINLDPNVSNELDWVIKQSSKSVIFYDNNQSIKPSDVPKSAFDSLKVAPNTTIKSLKSQFRSRGGNNYVNFLENLLLGRLSSKDKKFIHPNFEVKIFSNLSALVEAIAEKEENIGLSRLIAGFAWPWVTNPKKKYKNGELRPQFDILEDGVALRWNGVTKDWINSPNSVEEVGCIHTTQGYDLNYAGIIFGHEIGFNRETQEIVVYKDKYHDRNGKATVKSPERLKEYIVNIYKTIMLRGIHGTYVYVCDPALRDYMSRYIPLADDAEVDERRIIPLSSEEVKPFIDSVPLYSLAAAAGAFGPVTSAEEEQWIQLPPGRKASKDLFACRVIGDSMNLVIPNGSICLFRRYQGGSRNGKIVLVELSQFMDRDAGASYTVKEYKSRKQQTENGYQHERITLLPRSNDASYEPIELDEDSASEIRTIGEFIQVLGE